VLESNDDQLAYLMALGEQITVDGKCVWAIFENPYIEIDVGVLDVESTQPMATVRAIDVPSLERGDSVKRSNTNYQVAQYQPDGEGMVVLRLTET